MVTDNTAQTATNNHFGNLPPYSSTTSTETASVPEMNYNESHITTSTTINTTRINKPTNATLTNDAYDQLTLN